MRKLWSSVILNVQFSKTTKLQDTHKQENVAHTQEKNAVNRNCP